MTRNRPALQAVVATLATMWLLAVPSRAQTAASDVEARVSDLLGRMSLEEKIGQLNLASNNPNFARADVVAGRIGGVMAFVEPESIADVQAAARSSRLGIPLLVGLDVVHGLRTMFPLGLAEAASFDPGLARRSAGIAAREARAIGVNWTFAPGADLARDPRWGRMIEGFGEDPLLGRVFTRARVEGFRTSGLAVTLKHFAGYGAAVGGRDYDAAEISRTDLLDSYLPAFQAGIEAGAESVMSAFQTLNGVPATASHDLLTGILRGRWGYDGFVVSDWHAIAQLVPHGVAAGPDDAAAQAMLAGVDLDMADGLYRDHLPELVRSGRVSETRVTEAARRLLRAKVRMGLLDPPAVTPMPDAVPPPTVEARTASREAARDTLVLLRNTGVLPLGPRSGRIALVGGFADDNRELIGPHGALVRWEDTVTVRVGLTRRAAEAGLTVAFAKGCDPACTDEAGFAAAVAAAREAETVVAVMGEPTEWSGEGGSRARLTLPGRQAALLERLVDTGKPVVLVLIAGRPVELGPILDRLAGLVMAWFPGTEGGNAVADILFGDVAPSGKLPVTWPRTVGQVPLTYDRLPTGRPTEPGNRYTLRYADEETTPLFPFGFGLGYAPVSVADTAVETPRLARDGMLVVSTRLANTGARPAREVAQLYTRQPVASRSRPVRQLRAFEKISLPSGESRTVTFRVPVAELGFHRPDGSFAVEPGRFEVFVGTSSEAPAAGTFEVVE